MQGLSFSICLLCCVFFFFWGGDLHGRGRGSGWGVQNAIPWGFDSKLDSIPTTEAGSTFFSTKREGCAGMEDVKNEVRRFFFFRGVGGGWRFRWRRKTSLCFGGFFLLVSHSRYIYTTCLMFLFVVVYLSMYLLVSLLPYTLSVISTYLTLSLSIYISVHICNSREKRKLFVEKHNK